MNGLPTQTITIDGANNDHLVLGLYPAADLVKAELKPRLLALLEKIWNLGIYSPEELLALASWEKTFSDEFFKDPFSFVEGERASQLLCYLLENIIYEPFDSLANRSDLQDQILLLEDEVKLLLKLTLPNGMDVEKYYEFYCWANSEDDLFLAQVEVIDTFVNILISKLYLLGNEINAQSNEQYESLRLRLKTTCLIKQEAGNEAFIAVDLLIQKVKVACAALLHQEMEFAELFDRFERQEVELDQTLHRCEQILKRVIK